jgi:quinol monooxygenase YgiN
MNLEPCSSKTWRLTRTKQKCLYEVYQDDAAFDVHRDGPSIAQWREETAGMIVKICVTRCALVN